MSVLYSVRMNRVLFEQKSAAWVTGEEVRLRSETHLFKSVEMCASAVSDSGFCRGKARCKGKVEDRDAVAAGEWFAAILLQNTVGSVHVGLEKY